MLDHYTIRFESCTIIEFDEEDIMQMALIIRCFRRQHNEYTPSHVIIDPILDQNGKPVKSFQGDRIFVRRTVHA